MQVGEGSTVAKLAKPATAILLAAIVVAVVALQLITIPAAKECLFEKATDTAGLGTLISCFGAGTGTGTGTIWPMLLLFQSALFLVIAEAFYGGLSELLETVFASNMKTIFLVVAAVAILTAFYIAPGDVLLGDAYLFQAAAQIFKDAAAQGIPHHTFYWYGGSAHFEYYGQLYFAIAAVADAVFEDMNLTLKLVNWLLHIAAAAIAYLFALELTKSKKASFVAAIAYAVSYEHIARLMIHGRLMNSLTYLLLPLLLLIFERHVKGKISKTAAVSGLSLTASAIFLSNPGDGTFVLVSAAFYFSIRILQLRRNMELVQTAAIAAALFILLTSFWTIPFALEKTAVNAVGRVGELTSISFRPEILKEIVSFPGQRGIAIAYYLGIAQIALAAAAAALIIRKRKNKALTAVVTAAAITLFLMMVQSPRYAPALVLTLAVLAGAGSIYAAETMAAKARSALRLATAEQIFLLLTALVVLDSAAAIMQPYYPDFSAEKKMLVERIPAEAGFRTVDLHSDRRTFYPSLTYLATKTESLFGSLLEGAPKSTNYAIAIATRAAKERYDDGTGFSKQTLDGLYLFNVKYAALHPEQTGKKGAGRNFKAAIGLEKQIAVVKLENSPVIASRRIRYYSNSQLELEENYFLREKFETREINYGITDEITQLMKIDREKATAEAILVKETVADGEVSSSRSNEIEVKVIADETEHKKIKIAVEQNTDAFLQLSYSASPEISVIVDGKRVDYYTTAVGTIAIKTSKGKHMIEVVANPSKLRKTLFTISAVVAAAAAFLLIAKLFGRQLLDFSGKIL